jgi:hypothetical protein
MPVPPLATPRAVPRFKEPKDALWAERLVDEATVEKNAEEVALVKVVAPVKTVDPENVLLLASSVELAALIVMLADPSKETPLMVRAVWRVVAVFALPPIESEPAVPVSPVPAPVKVLAKMVPEAERFVVLAPPLKLWSAEKVLDVVVPKPSESVSDPVEPEVMSG